jgi:polyisoprenoid-binding protein YceI
LAVAAIALVGGLAFAFFKPPEEASGPIQTVPIGAEAPVAPDQAAAALPVAPQAAALDPATVSAGVALDAAQGAPSEEEAAESAGEDDDEAGPVAPQAAAGGDEEVGAAPAADSASAATAGAATFEIVPAASEARFYIDEVLQGADKTVVGTTDQVSGQIAVDPAAPAGARVGTILVNARTLTTDNDFRNRAIKNRILLTNEHEFVTFEPAAPVGLPEAVAVGDTLTFTLPGQLTVAGNTRETTFEVTLTVAAEDRLEGTATTTIRHADFGLTIPASRQVSAVGDEVVLELQFVAARAG